jgi:hypothetical protein
MRGLRLACLLGVAVWMTAFVAEPTIAQSEAEPAEAQPLGPFEIRAHVAEYLEDNCHAHRRGEIAIALRDRANPGTVRTQLDHAVRRGEQRAAALELAGRLNIDGFFRRVRRDIDGPDEEAIVKYIFEVQEIGATEFLFDRWKDKDIGSDSYEIVNDGFLTTFVRMPTMEKIRIYVMHRNTEEERRTRAGRILLYQMERSPEEDQSDIGQKWVDYFNGWEQDRKKAPVPGIDVLKMANLRIEGRHRRIDDNLKLFAGSYIEWTPIPEEWQAKIFFMRCHIRVISGNGATLYLETSRGKPGPLVRDGRWTVPDSENPRTAPMDAGAWEELAFYYEHNPRVSPFYRRVVVTVERKLTLSTGGLDGRFNRLYLTAGEGAVVVGGLSLMRQRK